MPEYAVRITHSFEVAQAIVHQWAMKCDKILAYEHNGNVTGKAHIHLLLSGTVVDKKQLRNIAASTKIPVKGNEYMSFKEWDGNESYITYMTKGIHNAKYNKGFEGANLLRLQALWVEPRAFVKQSKNSIICGDFYKYEFEETGDSSCPLAFYPLRTLVKAFVFNRMGEINGCWDISNINMYKMIMNTYIYKHKVSIPKGEKLWNW